MSSYHSNGKLLITGEYTVLDGALSLALPAKFGQSLSITENSSDKISWKALNNEGNIWFTANYNLNDIEIDAEPSIIETDNEGAAKTLLTILKEAKKLNPHFLINSNGIEATTILEFPENWGLGSSSTLINNVASWAKINAFDLLWNSFSGSGYDIACAQNNSAITYQLKNKEPFIDKVNFNPIFKDQLFFIHLNKKQNSREGIKRYQKIAPSAEKKEAIKKINSLTSKALKTTALNAFETIIEEHEDIIASLIQLKPVKEHFFKDFKGSIKSLGAWGGDFILATGEQTYVTSYFSAKGYNTILTYQEMIA
ncbi:GYDIA family GHMP kinase [Galbibacter sp. BG1]